MTKPPGNIIALVLAAGRASRFGGPQTKVLAPFEGEIMVRRAAKAALEAGLKTVVVCGYQASLVRPALADLPVLTVENAGYEAGLSTSLRVGLNAAGDADAALILLADMPRVDARLIGELCSAFLANPEVDAVVPVYKGVRGNPVVLAQRLFERVGQLSGDQGARKLLSASKAVMEIAIERDAVSFDVDTTDALAAEAKTAL